MTTAPEELDWVVYLKADRSKAGIIKAVAYPKAIEIAAERTGKPVSVFGFSPVYEYETHEQAKRRVAEGAK